MKIVGPWSEVRVNKVMEVILLTARDDKREIIEGLRSGANDYIVKPFGIQFSHGICPNCVHEHLPGVK
jgi:response regulator of citrate/malate metabolism